MTTVYTLASGSSGNALVFQWDDGCFLLDAGISCRRILSGMAGLGLSAPDLDGILITHTHTDHIYGLRTLLKRTDCPLLASRRTCSELDYRLEGVRDRLRPLPLAGGADSAFRPDSDGGEGNACKAVFPDCTITAFPTSHDAPGSCGFRLDTPDGGFGFLTDTGYVTDEARLVLPGVRFALLEANHDVETLRSGPYPYYLKQRILGHEGHLSNEDAAAFAVELASAGAEAVTLAHLSRENNTPAMARCAIQTALDGAGLSPALSVAPRETADLAFRASGRFSDIHTFGGLEEGSAL